MVSKANATSPCLWRVGGSLNEPFYKVSSTELEACWGGSGKCSTAVKTQRVERKHENTTTMSLCEATGRSVVKCLAGVRRRTERYDITPSQERPRGREASSTCLQRYRRLVRFPRTGRAATAADLSSRPGGGLRCCVQGQS